jgi:hypothetical protein
MFEGLRNWRALRERQKSERLMLRIYQAGFAARINGVPCEPPWDLDTPWGGPNKARWVAGWKAADREQAASEAR